MARLEDFGNLDLKGLRRPVGAFEDKYPMSPCLGLLKAALAKLDPAAAARADHPPIAAAESADAQPQRARR